MQLYDNLRKLTNFMLFLWFYARWDPACSDNTFGRNK